MQYKLFKTQEFLDLPNPDPGQRYRLEVLTAEDEAKNLGGMVGVLPPGTQPPLHYHDDRESVIFFIGGRGTEVVGEERILVKAGDVVFLRPKVVHTTIADPDSELRYIEFYTYPPLASDFVEVKAP